MPQIVDVAIGAVVTYLIVNGLKALSEYFGRDLSGNAALIAAAITTVIIFTVNTILALVIQIDPSTQSKIDTIIQILVILLGAMGTKRVETRIVAVLRSATSPVGRTSEPVPLTK